MKILNLDKTDNNSLGIICENMITLYEAGLSFDSIFNLIRELPVKKVYKKSLEDIRENIKQGISLEKAFRFHKDIYPDIFIGMIGIGEENGSLSKVLLSLKKYYYKRLQISKAIKSALIYPIIIFISLFLLLGFIIFYVLPNLSFIYENTNKSLPKLFIISQNIKSTFIKNPLLVLIYVFSYISIILILLSFFKKNIKINIFSKLKIVKLIYEFISLSIINIIISSGMNLVLGLDQGINSLSDERIKDSFIDIKESILKGKSLSESLSFTKNFTEYSISIVKIGEEAGSMDEKLETIIVYLEDTILKSITNIMNLIQPCSILFLGIVVIIFIINYILPIFDVIYSV